MVVTGTVGSARRGWMLVTCLLAGVLGSGGLVWQGSRAAFSGTTSNVGNTWASGTVALQDDSNGAARFSATGLVPNVVYKKCIVVTFKGNVSSTVKVYGTNHTGTLGWYLNWKIEEGTGGTFGTADCNDATFTPDGAAIYDSVLADDGIHGSGSFMQKNSYDNGVGTWTPSTLNSTKVYRFTYSVQDTNSAQNRTGGVDLVWEARSN